MAWKHPKVADEEVAKDPKLGDFFRSEPARHLVRELTQNTMDNRQNGRAKLKFSFVQRALEALSPYIEGLKEHVVASGMGSNVDWSKPRLLLVEDFGTKGLEGSVEDKRADGSFAKFWWRTGDSNKSAGSDRGGRHGVGKVVNTEASTVGAFFGYSVSGDPLQSTLLGRSSLKLHVLEGHNEEYQAEGTFYKALPGKGIAPAPFKGDEADAFAAIANVKRKPNERGLSIAVLWPKEEYSAKSIREACLQECLYQIASDELEVEIEGEVITEKNLRDILDKLAVDAPELDYLRASYDLIQTALTTPPEQMIAPHESIDPASGRLSIATFDATQIEKMRVEWAAKKPIIVSLNVLVRPKGGKPKTGQLLLALQKAADGESGWATCVRDDVTVAEAINWSRAAIALLVAKKDSLSGFLGDAEGPSHEKWFNEYVKGSYSYSKETLRTVKSALVNLYEVLMGVEEEDTVEGALTEYFYVNEIDDSEEEKEEPAELGDIEVVSTTSTPIKLRRIKNGFTTTLTEDGEKVVPFDLKIEAAYRVRMSDPFSAYSPIDFSFNQDGLAYTCDGADANQANDNKIAIKGVRKGFKLSATGFDSNREVALRWTVNEEKEGEQT